MTFSLVFDSRRVPPSNNRSEDEPVCRPNLPVSDLTCRDLPKSGGFVSTDPTWPLLYTSLFCCLSIFAQALRAAIVAAELPLRGKLRAEATIFSIDQRILELELELILSRWLWERGEKGGASLQKQARACAVWCNALTARFLLRCVC